MSANNSPRRSVRVFCRSAHSNSGFVGLILLILGLCFAFGLGAGALYLNRSRVVAPQNQSVSEKEQSSSDAVSDKDMNQEVTETVLQPSETQVEKVTEIHTTTETISGLPTSQEHALLVGNASGGWTHTQGLKFDGDSLSFMSDTPTAALHFNLQNATLLGMVIRGAKLQQANLTEWQNSDGNAVASIRPDGGAEFNSQGKDANFRVKAVGEGSALFVSGESGNVGIGTDTPSSALQIVGNQEIGGKLAIRNSANNEHLIELYPTGDTGYLSSNGGAFYIDNTNNIGAGYLVYSNAGAEAQGNLLNVKIDNAAFAQAGFYIDYDGSSNGVEIVSHSTDTSSNALSVTGHNPNDSTVGIIGYETGRGTVKVSHNGSSSTPNASAISIDLKGTNTAAQGLYIDSTATTGTSGNLLRLRNMSIDRFVVDRYGAVSIGQNGTNTSISKTGNTVGDEFFVGTTGAFRVQRSTAGSEAFRVQVNGDTQGRWLGTSDGQLKWGSGTAAQDVILRRNGAGVLLVDGAQLAVKSASTSSDVMTWTASDGSRLGRVNETSGGHGWMELANASGTALFLVRADGGDSYFNSGEFGIGTSSPGYKLDVQGNAATSYVASFTNAGNDAARYGLQVQAGANDGSGTTYYMTALDGDGTVVGYLQNASGTFSVNDPSDIRTKTNINSTVLDGLSIINGLRVVDFDRISQPGGKRHHGFIAQEVQSVFPYMVSESPDGLLTISKESLVPVLVKAMQQQQLQIESLGSLAQGETSSADISDDIALLKESVAELKTQQSTALQRSELSPLARWSLSSWNWLVEVAFERPVTFMSEVRLEGRLLNRQKDLAGYALFHPGDSEVIVTFTSPLSVQPVVQLTSQGTGSEPYLSEVGLQGFTIRLRDPAAGEQRVHWFALPSENAPTFESHSTPSPSPDISPSPEASPSGQP